jgi:FkbM family methyltransferase
VLDVGAHEGSYAAEVARLVARARVFAFEPHPASFERLSARAGAKYTPVRAAVGREPGSITLYDRTSAGSQHATTVAGAMETVHRDKDLRSWTVPALTLDDFLRERGIRRVHLLKIDTEGSELDVLGGARSALDAGIVDVVQLEFNAMNVVSRVFMRDLRDLLPAYTVHRLLPDGPVSLDPYEPAFEEIFAFQNVLFVSKRLDPESRKVLVG